MKVSIAPSGVVMSRVCSIIFLPPAYRQTAKALIRGRRSAKQGAERGAAVIDPSDQGWLRGTATIMTCCSERPHELAAKVGVAGSMDTIRFAASAISARIGVWLIFRD